MGAFGMQISELANQYTSTNATPETVSGARGVETLVSAVRNLTVGNIFEGTVNAIKGNQVILGLSSGTELAARIEANMQLVQGQSMFFQVKSNDGNTIAIRPYTVDGNGANLTLLNALKAANLPIADKYLTMVNTMMQEQMPIDKGSMNQMARILMNHPEMNVQTLVQMKKLHLPITTEMVSQFENYMDDKSAVHNALDRFVAELPTTMSSGNLSLEQMKTLDSQLLMILIEGSTLTQEAEQSNAQVQSQPTIDGQNGPEGQSAVQRQVNTEGQSVVQSQANIEGQPAVQTQVNTEGQVQAQANVEGQTTATTDSQGMVVIQDETEVQASSNNLEVSAGQNAQTEQSASQKVSNLIRNLFGEIGIAENDSPAGILQKLATHISTGENISKEALQILFSNKDVQVLMKQVLEQQLLLEPKDIKDGEKLKKLYDTLDGKSQSINALLQSAGLQDTPLAQTVQEIHANVEFMNQINEAYTFAQIPLKMANQNASGQLYVYTSKRNLEDPERDLTAFLHLDLEHLGATDVSVRMHKKEVSTKFYMDSDASYDLVKIYMPQLEERLRAKGYNCKIEIENEGRHVNFVEDFLKKDAPSTGMLHRYSFDVRT
ncbi:MAG: flagellar hook-length control protein FliK [Lachnospiraceae bacterium]|nr:flagellar hook-length control protein FliK [Lachnospiraceae bacterium]